MDKTTEERIAELLVEPNIQGMDWSLGSYILNNWKAGLPDRILTLIKQLGYTLVKVDEGLRERIAKSLCKDNGYRWEESQAARVKYLRETNQIISLLKEEK